VKLTFKTAVLLRLKSVKIRSSVPAQSPTFWWGAAVNEPLAACFHCRVRDKYPALRTRIISLKSRKGLPYCSHNHRPLKPVYLPTFTQILTLWHLEDHQEEEAEGEEANSRSSLVVVRALPHAY